MNSLFALSLLVVGILADDVVVLTDADFYTKVNSYPLALVEFYAPWCGHCKRLEPIYAEAATILKAEGITLAKVDATEEKKSANNYGISGFPTLKVFRDGQAEDYDGPRDSAQAIVDFMKKAAAPSTTEVANAKDYANIKNVDVTSKAVVLGLFASTADFTLFTRVMRRFQGKGIEGYHATASSVLEAAGYYSDKSGIFIYPMGSKKGTKIMFRGGLSEDRLQQWITANAIPAVSHMSKDNTELYRFFSQSRDSILIKLFFSGTAPQVPAWKGTRPHMVVRTVLIDRDAFPEESKMFGGSEAVLIDGYTSKQFALPKDVPLSELLTQFLDKKLKPFTKSEPLPPAAAPGEVAVVVGGNFADIVQDTTKGVLIEFYAPWCGHCKALAPKYEELAKKFAGNDKVVIAKFDATANEIPAEFQSLYKVEGFPTIYFAPAGDKKKSVVAYDGERDADSMHKWVLERI
eukprot:PhF_6_TR38737/c0_g1_i1/m.57986/K08056/PDIA3, GRP58; protein disulfide isomerase family A, member 3